jgi:energy-coupling factor transporter ATP-binding protein EcfA2
MRNRYPGAKPFTIEEALLFKGREEELEQLYQVIQFNQLVVLHGKSGLGKSSLINAGLVPKLEKSADFHPLVIRLYPSTHVVDDTPLIKVKDVLRKQFPAESTFLDQIIPHENSLWYWVKNWQISTGQRRFFLIFDQFEELFTYTEKDVIRFKEELAELLSIVTPQRFQDMYSILSQNEEVISGQEEQVLNTDFDVKVLLSIRSDRVHLLDRLSDYLPQVLSNNYELLALTAAGARDAIVLPAGIEGAYKSNAFDYETGSLAKILEFLKGEDGRVEAIQLQLICQSLEEKVKKEQLTRITDNDVQNLHQIIGNYYRSRMDNLGSEQEIKIATQFIEEGLILEEQQQRSYLDESQIRQFFS